MEIKQRIRIIDFDNNNNIRLFNNEKRHFQVLASIDHKILHIIKLSKFTIIIICETTTLLYSLTSNTIIKKTKINHKQNGIIGLGAIKRLIGQGFLIFEPDAFFLTGYSLFKGSSFRLILMKHAEHVIGTYEGSFSTELFVFDAKSIFVCVYGNKHGKTQRLLYKVILEIDIFSYNYYSANSVESFAVVDTELCAYEIDFSKYGTSMGIERIEVIGQSTFIFIGSIYIQIFDFYKGVLKMIILDDLDTKILKFDDVRVVKVDEITTRYYNFDHLRWLSLKRQKNIVDICFYKNMLIYCTCYSVFLICLKKKFRIEIFRIKTKQRYRIISVSVVSTTLLVTLIERQSNFSKIYIIQRFNTNKSNRIKVYDSCGLFIK